MDTFEPVLWPEKEHNDWLNPGHVCQPWSYSCSQLLGNRVTDKWQMVPNEKECQECSVPYIWIQDLMMNKIGIIPAFK